MGQAKKQANQLTVVILWEVQRKFQEKNAWKREGSQWNLKLISNHYQKDHLIFENGDYRDKICKNMLDAKNMRWRRWREGEENRKRKIFLESAC